MKSGDDRKTRHLVCILLLLVPFSLHAGWPKDPQVNVPISAAIDWQGVNEIGVVSDGSGGAIVVWDDFRGYDVDIYAQRVDAEGSVLWNVDGVVVCDYGFQQERPVIVSDGAGGAIIAWLDNRGGGSEVYAQRVDSSGSVQWPSGAPSNEGVYICSVSGGQQEIVIGSDGAGGVVFAWQHSNGEDLDIHAQKVDSLGAFQWPQTLPSGAGVTVCAAAGNQWEPSITADYAGGAIIAWEDGRGVPHIYAQRVDSSGTALWAPDGVVLCDAPLGQSFPGLCPDGDGGAIVAWIDSRSGTSGDIYAQRVDHSGSTLWENNGVAVCSAPDNQFDIDIVETDDGGAVVVWADYRNTASMDDIYAQKLAADGSRLWTGDGVTVTTAIDQQDAPQVTSTPNGGAIVTWTDYRSGSNRDVYAQVVYPNGYRGFPDGFPVSTAADNQVLPRIAAEGRGGAIIVWKDFRNRQVTSSDIYAQAVLLGLVFSDGFESGDTIAW